ncbi:MAG: PocR ligand-binding domain-containing protein [Anaerolineales bacterium]
MTELLTTKEVEDLLSVDRTTVYRMLKDGRLTGIKVGSHWRFRREEIDNLIYLASESGLSEPNPSEILPMHCIQSIQDVFAQIAEVGAVVTDMDGEPVSKMSNPSNFCALIQKSPSGRQACLNSWKKLAEDRSPNPVFQPCHAGLQYARDFIQVKNEPQAMIVAGQFMLDHSETNQLNQRIHRLAEEHGIEREKLEEAAAELQMLDDRKQNKIAHWISEVAKTFGDIGTERAEMIRRLRVISEMSNIDVID